MNKEKIKNDIKETADFIEQILEEIKSNLWLDEFSEKELNILQTSLSNFLSVTLREEWLEVHIEHTIPS